MEPALRFVLRHSFQNTGMIDQELRHEPDEDGAHPVKAEPLRAFVPDDIRNTGRHPGEIGRRSCVFVFGHNGWLPNAVWLGKIRPASTLATATKMSIFHQDFPKSLPRLSRVRHAPAALPAFHRR